MIEDIKSLKFQRIDLGVFGRCRGLAFGCMMLLHSIMLVYVCMVVSIGQNLWDAQAMAAYGPPVRPPIRFQLATPQITNCPFACHTSRAL